RILRGAAQHHREARPRPAPGLIGSGGMRFELSEDQALLRSSTRDYFTKDAPLERSRRIMEHDARRVEAPRWRRLAEMGSLGLTVPADKSGQGLGAVELAVVCEEAGRSACPGRCSTPCWRPISWRAPAARMRWSPTSAPAPRW